MSSRLIRDDMLDSERVQTLPIEARWLFVTVMLSADDVGLFEVNAFKLGRRAGIDQKNISFLTQCIADADLVRLYESDGKQFGFIPRFRQRLQIKRTKHPLPALALMADDEDATNKIKYLTPNPPLSNRDAPLPTVAQPSEPEPEPEEEQEKEPTVLVVSANAAPTRYRVPNCPADEIVSLYHSHLPALPAIEVLNDGRKRAIAARWREVCAEGKLDKTGGLEWFGWFFAHTAKSSFLMGKTPGKSGRTWTATLDFLMAPQKFARVVEGAYHGATA